MPERVYLTKNTVFLDVTQYGKDGGSVIPVMWVGLPTYKTTQHHLPLYFIVTVVIIPDFTYMFSVLSARNLFSCP
jgi:hypothetical protein